MARVIKYRGIPNDDLAKIWGDQHKVSAWSKYLGIDWDYGPELPVGLIIPYNANGAAPSGWNLWNLPAGRNLVGAGSSYAVGATGGSITLGCTLPNNSNHIGSLNASNGANSLAVGAGTAHEHGTQFSTGAHSHTFNLSYTEPHRQLQFIKLANSNVFLIPALGFALADGTFTTTGLTQYHNNDGRILLCNNSLGTGGGTPGSAGTTTGGSHRHYPDRVPGGGTLRSANITAGSHSHTVVPSSVTSSILRAYLTAWSLAAAEFPINNGFIGMYENLTPPTGWSLCDGTGGTPDLRNYFVELGTTGNHGTVTGNGTVQVFWSGQTHTTHTHRSGSNNNSSIATFYHDTYTAPAHAGNQSGIAHTPPYYGIAFIMYTG